MLLTDHTVQIARDCIGESWTYNDSIRYCRNNATFSGFKYFFYENQCCMSYTYNTSSSMFCYCADNYCNTKVLLPTIVPRTNDTTTFSWYIPQNTTSYPNPSNVSLPWNSNNTFNNARRLSCYDCTYSSDDNTTDGSTNCGQSLDPARVANCSGSGCYSYIYNYSSAGQGRI